MRKRYVLLAGALVALLTAMPFFGADDSTRLTRLEARVKRLEKMLEALLARLDIEPEEVEPPASQIDPAIRSALLQGNKILAIKLYREQTGLGLKDSKDAIDALEQDFIS